MSANIGVIALPAMNGNWVNQPDSVALPMVIPLCPQNVHTFSPERLPARRAHQTAVLPACLVVDLMYLGDVVRLDIWQEAARRTGP